MYIMWHKKYQHCFNCISIKNPHKAKGYCQKCYPIQLRIEKVEKWDFAVHETLATLPKVFLQLDEKVLLKIKKGVLSQLKNRLDWFKIREQRLKDDIYGIDIEYGLERIASYSGVRKKNLFHSSANTFDHNFSMKQKKIIFEFIDDIEQNINWKGIDWNDVFMRDR